MLTPSYAATLLEAAEERGIDLAASSVRRVLVAGEPGGGEPAFRAMLQEGWGASVTEAMGIGDIGPSLWGSAWRRTGCTSGPAAWCATELVDPETGEPAPARGQRDRGARARHLRRRAAPLLQFGMPTTTSRC